MSVDLTEYHDTSNYASLNALFTRKLVGHRQIDDNPDYFVSPTDSLITEQGRLQEYTLLQIKGMEYSVRRLLTEKACYLEEIADGDFINFYLSPGDYHRYHAPTTLSITKLLHVPGTLYPVNLPSVKKRKNLFTENERVILECTHHTGNVVYLVFIGAFNVGNMVFEFEPRVKTNTTSKLVNMYEYDNLQVRKGECLGYFKMGSTVIMISQKDFLELKTTVNQKVKFGDLIAQVSY